MISADLVAVPQLEIVPISLWTNLISLPRVINLKSHAVVNSGPPLSAQPWTSITYIKGGLINLVTVFCMNIDKAIPLSDFFTAFRSDPKEKVVLALWTMSPFCPVFKFKNLFQKFQHQKTWECIHDANREKLSMSLSSFWRSMDTPGNCWGVLFTSFTWKPKILHMTLPFGAVLLSLQTEMTSSKDFLPFNYPLPLYSTLWSTVLFWGWQKCCGTRL